MLRCTEGPREGGTARGDKNKKLARKSRTSTCARAEANKPPPKRRPPPVYFDKGVGMAFTAVPLPSSSCPMSGLWERRGRKGCSGEEQPRSSLVPHRVAQAFGEAASVRALTLAFPYLLDSGRSRWGGGKESKEKKKGEYLPL